ncbi:MAG: hypothetical protein H7282_01575 [Cytophagaceae bacterium]|nr:hypothetical protein [Cytophagaceae bacterium]
MKKNILIVCDNNTLYSKLAEAYFKKYAGHWKNIFSAGINIDSVLVSETLKVILAEDNLESTIDYTLKSVKEYNLNSFDYIIALTEQSFNDLKKELPEDRIILVNIETIRGQKMNSLESINDKIKLELFEFVKKGPIKRWLELN